MSVFVCVCVCVFDIGSWDLRDLDHLGFYKIEMGGFKGAVRV